MNDITIITAAPEPDNLDPTRFFGILISRSLTSLHMLHWYTKNFNFHEIIGELYSDLNDLFDKFQEEIIGTSKNSTLLFPGFDPESVELEIELYKGDDKELLENYYKLSTTIIAILSSREISNYIDTVQSGLNNTKEDILSRINKTNYLLDMLSL